MSATLLVIFVAVLIIAAVIPWAWMQNRRSTNLRSRFGPEYNRVMHEYGNRSSAEKALENRAARIEMYHLRSLTEQERGAFSVEWHLLQTHFVDDPKLSVREADHVVSEVMRTRGYPMADFNRRAEDLSVDHPEIVRNYRTAHEIAIAQQEGRATTEDLRRAIVLYRELFDELLETQSAGPAKRRL